MLKIKNLHVYVDEKHILRGVDLRVKPGEVHAIMGPNGSGKSTFSYTLMGHPAYKLQNTRYKTQVNLDGKDLLKLTPDERARMGLFLAFQNPVSVEGVSVYKLLRQAKGKIKGRLKLSILEFSKQINSQAKELGVSQDLLKRSINEGFSGGEKKRIEILQMSVLQPRYAILDETDSGLDIDALRVVSGGINKVVKANKKLGVILITHYQRILRFIKPDFVHVMVSGRFVESGGRELAERLENEGYKKWVDG